MPETLHVPGVGTFELPDDPEQRRQALAALPAPRFGGAGGSWPAPPGPSMLGQASSALSQANQALTSVRPDLLMERALAGPSQLVTNVLAPSRETPEMVGGIAGGLLGAARGGPMGMAMAGLGGATAEAGRLGVESLLGTSEAPPTLGAAGWEVAKSGLRQAGLEGVGRTAAYVLAPFTAKVRPYVKPLWDWLQKEIPATVKPGAKATAATIERFTRAPFFPEELTGSSMVDFANSLTEYSIIAGPHKQGLRVDRAKLLNALSDGLADRMFQGAAQHPKALADLFEHILTGKVKASRLAEDVLYNTIAKDTAPVRQLVPRVEQVATGLVDEAGEPIVREVTRMVEEEVPRYLVNTRPLKDYFAGAFRKAEQARGIGAAETGDTLVREIMALPDQVSADVAIDLFQRFRSISGALELVRTAPKGMATKARGLMNDAIEDTLGREAPELHRMWMEARRLVKANVDELRNPVLKRLVKLAKPDLRDLPDSVPGAIFSSANSIRRTRHIMDEPEWAKFQRWKVGDLFRKSSRPDPKLEKVRVLNGTRFLEELLTPDGSYQPWVKAAFTPQQAQNLRRLGEVWQATQVKGVGSGRMLVRLFEAGAMVRMAMMGARISTGAGMANVDRAVVGVLVGPSLLTRLFNSPRTARWILEGIRTPLASREGFTLSTRLAQSVVQAMQAEAAEEVQPPSSSVAWAPEPDRPAPVDFAGTSLERAPAEAPLSP